ncbi:MAG: DUF3619 family protein [Pseudomonadota bacterium]
MNNSKLYTPRDLDALQARFALRVAARLTERAEQTPADISERLRFAREQALARALASRRSSAAPMAVVAQPGGSATLARHGRQGSAWWLKLASFVPLLMLVAGLSVIEELHDRTQIAAAAEIDVALLADDLPPDAYRDEGFVEFMKTVQE